MAGVQPTRGRSIAQSIMTLVIAALAAATLVLFGITFNGPPPMPAPIPLARLAETLRTGRPPSGLGRTIRFRSAEC